MTEATAQKEIDPFPIDVLGFGAVFLPVTDVYVSGQWYIHNLGLTLSPNTPLEPGVPHVILHYAPRTAGLFLLDCSGSPGALRRKDGQELLTFCFVVSDIESALARLRANGVRLETDAPIDRGNCGLNLKCYDPDGNKFEIVQASQAA
jgi:catechol 2,3-dioxygenase-like lactoylglutathione lyase family enzyme